MKSSINAKPNTGLKSEDTKNEIPSDVSKMRYKLLSTVFKGTASDSNGTTKLR